MTKRTLFLYSGEGTSSRQTEPTLLRHSALWSQVEEALDATLDIRLEELWTGEVGQHRCPSSPLLTLTTQLCLADLWSRWGFEPDVVVGHDFRSYSGSIKLALITGLMAAGLRVKDIGLSLSPMAYFAQFDLDCDAVAMVTASHNENGLIGF